MTDAERHFGPSSRVGGAECLDFVNTLHWRGTDAPVERLTTYDDLLAWATYGNLMEASQAARLREMAREQPAEAERILRRAWTLREALHRIVTAERQRHESAEDDVALLNGELGVALAHASLCAETINCACRIMARSSNSISLASTPEISKLPGSIWRTLSLRSAHRPSGGVSPGRRLVPPRRMATSLRFDRYSILVRLRPELAKGRWKASAAAIRTYNDNPYCFCSPGCARV